MNRRRPWYATRWNRVDGHSRNVEHDRGESSGSAALAARRAGYPWPEQMDRKMSRNAEFTQPETPRARTEVLAARQSGFPLYCARLGHGRARQFLKLRRSG